MARLSLKVTGKTLSLSTNQTLYNIEVSSETSKWTINRYFKHLMDLDILVTRLSTKETDITFPMGELSKNSEATHEKLAAIEKYLSTILQIPQLMRHESILDFFDVPAKIRPHFVGFKPENIKPPLHEQSSPTAAVRVCLKNLHEDPNKVKVLKQFENMVLVKKTQLGEDAILLFFKGENECEGLIKMCGDLMGNFTSSYFAILLLYNLLDIEKNPYANKYLRILCSLGDARLQQLNIHAHILSERGSKLVALKLAALISTIKKNFLESCVKDSWSRNIFKEWYATSQYRTETNRASFSTSIKPAVKFKSLNVRAFVEQTRQTFQKILEEDSSHTPWEYTVFSKHFNMRYKYNVAEKMTTIRFEVKLQCSLEKIGSTLFNCARFEQWCVKCESQRLVQAVDDATAVVEGLYKSFVSPYKRHTVCVLVSKTDIGKDLYVTLNSVDMDMSPKGPNYKTGTIAPSGVRAFSINDKEVQAEFVLQFKDDCISMFSSDVLGESRDLIDSLAALKRLCEQ